MSYVRSTACEPYVDWYDNAFYSSFDIEEGNRRQQLEEQAKSRNVVAVGKFEVSPTGL